MGHTKSMGFFLLTFDLTPLPQLWVDIGCFWLIHLDSSAITNWQGESVALVSSNLDLDNVTSPSDYDGSLFAPSLLLWMSLQLVKCLLRFALTLDPERERCTSIISRINDFELREIVSLWSSSVRVENLASTVCQGWYSPPNLFTMGKILVLIASGISPSGQRVMVLWIKPKKLEAR